jgi:hypothetical protein
VCSRGTPWRRWLSRIGLAMKIAMFLFAIASFALGGSRNLLMTLEMTTTMVTIGHADDAMPGRSRPRKRTSWPRRRSMLIDSILALLVHVLGASVACCMIAGLAFSHRSWYLERLVLHGRHICCMTWVHFWHGGHVFRILFVLSSPCFLHCCSPCLWTNIRAPVVALIVQSLNPICGQLRINITSALLVYH